MNGFQFIFFLVSFCLIYVICDEPIKHEERPMCDPKFLGGVYTLPHPVSCDQFYSCKNGTLSLFQCADGYAYSLFRGCRLAHLVNCATRPKLQPAIASKSCPHLYGVFNDPRGCGRFFKCEKGTAVEDRCGQGLMFDDVEKGCREPTSQERAQCAQPALLGCSNGQDGKEMCSYYKCPTSEFLPFGDHSRHPYPGNCHFYVMCFKDGSVKIGGCPQGSGFDLSTFNCEKEQTVAACKH